MKNHKKLFSLLLVLCLLFSMAGNALAASYTGNDVVPGLSGIQPGDELTHPDNTDWATLTASWGVRVSFVDWDESQLKSEVVPVTDNTPGSSSAPSDPTRDGYTFTGWERHDTTSGTATLNDDGTVTGVNGPGPIVFIAKYTKVNYAVDYSWTGDVPDGVTLPTDDTAYNWHDTPTADTTYTASTSIPGTKDGVPGTYTFSGWDASDDADLTANGMEGDVTFKGVWTFTPDTYKVTYVVNDDGTYGTPDDAAVPTDTTAYDYNANVTVADDLTTAWTTSDGTATGIPGVWTFTSWDKDDFQITENTTITGSWKFTPNAYAADYAWTGDVPDGVTLPTDDTAYNWHDTPTADTTYTASTSITGTKDGVPGTYTFSGWDASDDADLTANGMEGDVTFKGVWTFTPTPTPPTDPEVGNLTVSKTISGNAADSSKAFSFTVTLGDTSVSGTYGDMSFTNGVATFTLKGGESKTATNLPAGTTFAVAEADYSADGYVTTKSGDTGTITDGQTATAAFTNTKNTTTPPTDPKVGNLTVSKTISGNAADSSKAFSFTVTLGDKTVNGAYGDMSFTNGVATFTLKGGESKTATNLPAGTSYTVAEADYSADGYVTTKSGDTGTITDGKTATAAFTNTKNTTTPTPTPKPADPTTPKTGDNSNLALWIMLLAASVAGMTGTILYSKKRKTN